MQPVINFSEVGLSCSLELVRSRSQPLEKLCFKKICSLASSPLLRVVALAVALSPAASETWAKSKSEAKTVSKARHGESGKAAHSTSTAETSPSQAPAKAKDSQPEAAVEKSAEVEADSSPCGAKVGETAAELWQHAECLFKEGNDGPAIADLRKITQLNPRDVDAYFTASWLLWNESRKLGGEAERKKVTEALAELSRARASNPTSWEVATEIGDFYYLRLNEPEKAYAEYLKARSLYDGDEFRNVQKADNGRRASVENRIARTAEKLDRKGEAVEASCRALFFDPDDKAAKERVERLYGSCVRKGVKDPRASNSKPSGR